MYDQFNRKINYLRVSVTDRCNLRCVYCMPEEGIKLISHNDILSFEEIIEVIQIAVNLGIDKIRITGGEPLVRKGIVNLVQEISKIQGIKDFGMTTNGILLEDFAEKLANAGLNRINISLDTLNPETFKQITRGGDIQKVLNGIKAAKKAGLMPVKINCVIKESPKEKDAMEVAEFCHKNGLDIRYIHLMELDKGSFSVVEGGEGGNCKTCNRLRLSANGFIMPCLFSDIAFNIRELGIKNAILKAVENKPKCGTSSFNHKFYNIGG